MDNNFEEFEEFAKCEWCNNEFEISELEQEVSLGLLCDRCICAIESRGEELEFVD